MPSVRGGALLDAAGVKGRLLFSSSDGRGGALFAAAGVKGWLLFSSLDGKLQVDEALLERRLVEGRFLVAGLLVKAVSREPMYEAGFPGLTRKTGVMELIITSTA
jgi:hypothetical protein